MSLIARCRALGLAVEERPDGWYWIDTDGNAYGPYDTQKQAALYALQSQEN